MVLSSPSRRRAKPRLARQRGAVAIMVGLSLAVLIGFVGLALDLGKLYVAKSEQQNSMDACALAAARDLTGATPLAVSEAAGITAGSINKMMFQKETTSLVADLSVEFSDAPDHAFYPKDSAIGAYPLDTIKYVKCSNQRSGIATWFIQVLNLLPQVNIGPSTVSSFAMATTASAQTACAIPIFVCKPDPASPYKIGQWLSSKFDASNPSQYGPGSFGWASLVEDNAKSLMEQLQGAGQCNLTGIEKVGTQGNVNSIPDYWNSRFGIAPPSGKRLGVPDFTGYAYNDTTWTAKENAYPDFVNKRKAYERYQGDAAMGWTKPNGTKGTALAQEEYKSGADRRLMLAPVVDCAAFSGGKAPVTAWACLLMIEPMQNNGNNNAVRVEYRGISTSAGSPCATQGIPGSGTGAGPQVPMLVQ